MYTSTVLKHSNSVQDHSPIIHNHIIISQSQISYLVYSNEKICWQITEIVFFHVFVHCRSDLLVFNYVALCAEV